MRVIGLAGWSGAGKTTLMQRLIPGLTQAGVRVSTVKHAHHDFDIDQPGKDSWLHRQAGATEVLVGSSHRWALMHELRDALEPDLAELLGRLSPVEFVVVEGFKRGPHPKIEVHRSTLGKPFLHPDDPTIVAMATDKPVLARLPQILLDDVASVVSLVLEHAMPVTAFQPGPPPLINPKLGFSGDHR